MPQPMTFSPPDTSDAAASVGVTGRSVKRILFVSEAATLAHVARPIVLARGLDPTRYHVGLAWNDRYQTLFPDLPFERLPISSVSPQQFMQALAKGQPLFDRQTLHRYVEEDLRVIETFEPDLIVGDLRLSLSVSARLARVPYACLTNAYWSPYARPRYDIPEHPLTRVVGVPAARQLFRLARPAVFAAHARPLNRVRRAHGLPSLGLDLRSIYTDGDLTLYADVPELVPTYGRPDTHHYIGPVLWSPPVALPAWWEKLPPGRPIVYVTLGSSGAAGALHLVLQALADLEVTVLAATAGRIEVRDVPSNAFVADFLPGEAAAARASLVICNGGSPTTHQALAAGCPVLAIPSNLDQYLNMHFIQEAGAGQVLRAGRLTTPSIRGAVAKLVDDSTCREAAARMASVFARYAPHHRLASAIESPWP